MQKITILFVFIAGISCEAVASEIEDNKLIGVWVSGATAGMAIYGALVITSNEISWKGAGSSCKTTYKIVEKGTSNRYPGMDSKPTYERTFTIYKIKLGPPDCREDIGSFLFAIPSDNEGYAEVLEYGKDGRPTGVLNFSKGTIRPEDFKQ